MGRDNVEIWPSAPHQVNEISRAGDVVIEEDSQEGFLSFNERPILARIMDEHYT